MQAPDEQQPDRPGEVEQFPGAGHYLVRVAQVGPDHVGAVVLGCHRPGMREHHGVVVHVHHARTGVSCLGDLMHVRAARQTAADIEELADPGIAQESHRAHHELAITAHGVQDLRHRPQHLLGRCPVGAEAILAAQPVVIHPGRVSDIRADIRRNPAPRAARSSHVASLKKPRWSR